jgi:hypothetical protein
MQNLNKHIFEINTLQADLCFIVGRGVLLSLKVESIIQASHQFDLKLSTLALNLFINFINKPSVSPAFLHRCCTRPGSRQTG